MATTATIETPLLLDTVGSAVDYEGRPVLLSNSGGWRSASFIIGVEVAERFAYYGISCNLITYLTGPLGQSTATAAENVNAWSGTASLLPLLGAFLADSFLGRYRTIVIASLFYILGLGLLTLSAMLFSPTTSSDNLDTETKLGSANQLQVILFFVSLYIVAVGQGGHKPCVQAFGADQFDGQDPVECRAKRSFFNWWYFGVCAGGTVTVMIMSYIQDNLSWGLGFGIPCIVMVIALGVFLLGTRTYRYSIKGKGKSPFVRIGRVFVAAVRNWQRSPSALATEKELGRALPHHSSGQFKFLNKALPTPDGSKEEGEVCTVNEVEEAKAALRLVPIWATSLGYGIVYAQTSTFFIKQGATMDRTIFPGFDIPAASLHAIGGLAMLLFISVYDCIFVPTAKAFTRKPHGITLLQRIGTGMFLHVICMVVAALIEMKRLETAQEYGLVDMPDVTVPLSIWWLVPQYVLSGIADVFTMVGLQEFFYDQVPIELRSVGLALYLCIIGVGSFSSSFLVSIIEEATGGDGRDSWFADNLNANPDLEALMAFKAASDTANKLTSWNSTSNPCDWSGVSCLHNRVSRLVLEDLDLRGSFEPITALTQLRVLSLKRNRLSGHIPDLSNLTALKLLFLSGNDFSGEFPPSVPTLSRLYRLDLSYNNLSGKVPVTINGLTRLLTLRLEENRFSGSISGLNLLNLQDFNVSGNQLSGEVPRSLSGFPESTFAQNPALCGSPMQTCKNISTDPTRPGSGGAIASPLMPTNPNTIVASSPSSLPSSSIPSKSANNHHHAGTSKLSPAALIAIILGDVLVLAFVSLILYCYFWRSYATKMRDGKRSKLLESEKIVYSSSPYTAQPGFERGQMVFFEGVKRFELEDLLRASAEMLGKGGFGTAYKAVLDDGNVVAVKRLKDASVGGKREFEQHMELLGRLRHPNVVSLRAYYFAREEKLLVYDYMPNGSLFWLLHGNRGPGRTPLDWTTRLKIAAGAARGLAFIHSSCKSLRLTHGNIKSTNILLDRTGNARVSDFGLSVFAAPSLTAPRANGYRAPESGDGRKLTQKSDVYSFGVLLLELLTGKCPSVVDSGGSGGGYGGGVVDLPRWVQSVVREEWTAEVFDLELMRYKDIEEEMVGLLQVAMSCTAASPDQRPKMCHVVKMIEDIRGVETSPCHDSLDSVSESPSLSEDACGASQ